MPVWSRQELCDCSTEDEGLRAGGGGGVIRKALQAATITTRRQLGLLHPSRHAMLEYLFGLICVFLCAIFLYFGWHFRYMFDRICFGGLKHLPQQSVRLEGEYFGLYFVYAGIGLACRILLCVEFARKRRWLHHLQPRAHIQTLRVGAHTELHHPSIQCVPFARVNPCGATILPFLTRRVCAVTSMSPHETENDATAEDNTTSAGNEPKGPWA